MQWLDEDNYDQYENPIDSSLKTNCDCEIIGHAVDEDETKDIIILTLCILLGLCGGILFQRIDMWQVSNQKFSPRRFFVGQVSKKS